LRIKTLFYVVQGHRTTEPSKPRRYGRNSGGKIVRKNTGLKGSTNLWENRLSARSNDHWGGGDGISREKEFRRGGFSGHRIECKRPDIFNRGFRGGR